MPASVLFVGARTWLVVVLTFFVLSVGAVAAHGLPYSVPAILSHVLDSFASPGEFLWWATLGGAFVGYPSGLSGYTIWILGNTLFWVFATVMLVAIGKWLYSTIQHLRR